MGTELKNTPWIASIGYASESAWIHKCIGNIIAENKILMPAQCGVYLFNNGTKIKVGSQNTTLDSASIFYTIGSIWLSLEFDIGVVYTTENINFTDEVRPVCIPQSPEEPNSFFRYYFLTIIFCLQ